jgi:outer membrane protein OmpA-like peptidoglycan-associated protein
MKKIISFVIALFAVVSMSAQNYAGSSSFLDNWSIGARGGVQTNLKQWNTPQGAVAGLELNKQLTPLFGLTIEGVTGFNNVRNWNDLANHFCNGVAVDQLNVLVDGRFNLTNALFMYQGKPRFFEVEALGGVGYGHTYVANAKGYDDVLAKAGLNLNFNIGKNRAWTINIQPAIIWNVKNAGKLDVHNAVGQLTAGLIYHFKTSNGKRYIQKYDVEGIIRENGVYASQINDLEEQGKEKDAEIAALRKALANQPLATNAVATAESAKEIIEKTTVVFFAQNSSVLTDDAKAVLDGVTAKNVKVVATASPEGTAEYNKRLSEKRAAVVCDYLTKKGVNVVSAEGLGVKGDASGRVAIVTVE